MPKRPRRYDIHRPEELEVLTSPVRMEILAALESQGPCTVRELAIQLGRPQSALYFHIDQLVEVGLCTQSEGLLETRGREMVIDFEGRSKEGRNLLAQIASTILRPTARAVAKAYEKGIGVTRGRGRNTHVCSYRARLSKDEVREVNEHIQRIAAIFTSKRDPDPSLGLYTISVAMVPVEPKVQKRG